MISDDRLSKALHYLAETDEACAHFRADYARAEHKAKAIKGAIFTAIEKGSVADREAEAINDPAYVAAMAEHFDLFCKYEAMKNKRATEALVIEVWRSLNSARKKGNVV